MKAIVIVVGNTEGFFLESLVHCLYTYLHMGGVLKVWKKTCLQLPRRKFGNKSRLIILFKVMCYTVFTLVITTFQDFCLDPNEGWFVLYYISVVWTHAFVMWMCCIHDASFLTLLLVLNRPICLQHFYPFYSVGWCRSSGS